MYKQNIKQRKVCTVNDFSETCQLRRRADNLKSAFRSPEYILCM